MWSAASGERSEVRGRLRYHPDRNRTELGGRRLPYWREFLACAREAEPSDALRQQTDPLEPAGRRFANFFFDSSFERFSQRRWSAERPAIGPTRWRRLLAAVASS